MPNPEVSIIIPTKNAGPEFSLLLSKLRSQRGLSGCEIIIADSGSTDTTISEAQRANCKILRISPQSFHHGNTRNAAAELASGRLLLFMVQDALPSGSFWIRDLVNALARESSRNIAALSCLEFPKHDADLYACFVRHDHYKMMGGLQKDKILKHSGDSPSALRKNGQISNVACLIQKNIFSRFKFKTAYAEDLDLGVRLIRAGYRLGLLSSIPVIHSHNRPAFYFLKRSFVDALELSKTIPGYYNTPSEDPALLLPALKALHDTALWACHQMARFSEECSPINFSSLTVQKLETALFFQQKYLRLLPNHRVFSAGSEKTFYCFVEDLNTGKARPCASLTRRLTRRLTLNFWGFAKYVERTHPVLDVPLQQQMLSGFLKILAVLTGKQIALAHLSMDQKNRIPADYARLEKLLRKGI